MADPTVQRGVFLGDVSATEPIVVMDAIVAMEAVPPKDVIVMSKGLLEDDIPRERSLFWGGKFVLVEALCYCFP